MTTTTTASTIGFTCPGNFTRGPEVRFVNLYNQFFGGQGIIAGLGDTAQPPRWFSEAVSQSTSVVYDTSMNNTFISKYVAPDTTEPFGFVEGVYVGGGSARYGGGVGGSIVYANNSCQSNNFNPNCVFCGGTADSRPRGNCFDLDKVTTLKILVKNNACGVGSFLVFQNITLSIANQNPISLPDVGPVNVNDCGLDQNNTITICYTFAGLMDGWTVTGEANRGNISGCGEREECLPSEANRIEVSVIQAPPSTFTSN
ncbi:unnamed protein product [Polarella glacialis]|uniref:Uncharacterized protein n=1 Tax=Polarella glacialis TaxID=89957 RepID=A0A813D0T3_POLGL|nr:unnamed protein product [Polarella glacialis]CAE8624152.1 unnamed protein product [Polarella glacialis]